MWPSCCYYIPLSRSQLHRISVSGANCSVPLWVSDPTLALVPDSAVAGEGGGAGSLVGVVITVLVLSLAITVTVYYR